jgi:hypothetical protein
MSTTTWVMEGTSTKKSMEQHHTQVGDTSYGLGEGYVSYITILYLHELIK